ncbi:dihydrofolate reductase family protein [Lysinibacter cavernae]|uniref:Dihydrofolate reductase n=1 Tax=Lysinibacter cavernae TaxID=1640652 RepID=A0A7X5TTU6_9MICO|nr:dihydrofolate reductase family protein [Lysinibacter cavernae]NIH54996.1 dihydrofolate reductase [Lysinibacter cavernae]
MSTQFYTATSIDGYIADSNNSLDWLLALDNAPGMEGEYPRFISQVGAVAMGSTTYEWMLEHHINADPAEPADWPYEQPTWVFTSRPLPVVEGANIRFVRGAVEPVHAEMLAAAGGANVWIVGGGDLAGQFYDAGLLNELILSVASVTLGGGAPLLPRAITGRSLALTSATQFGESFAVLTYQVRYEDQVRPAASGGLTPSTFDQPRDWA